MFTSEQQPLLDKFTEENPDCFVDARIWAGLERLGLFRLKVIVPTDPTNIEPGQWDRQTARWANEIGAEVISYDRKPDKKGLKAACGELGVPLSTPSEWLDSDRSRRDRYPELFATLRAGVRQIQEKGLRDAAADEFLAM